MEIPGLPRPKCSYLVCATPRSGSTLLCKALEATGVAGHPQEFFEAKREAGPPAPGSGYLVGAPGVDLQELLGDDPQPPAPAYSSLRDVDDYRAHLRRTLEWGTTENGVFGAKIMWGHRADFLPLARTLPELTDLPERQLLAALFPDPNYVWVRRGDTVRQAVSLWKAIQTQSWRAGQGGGATRFARPFRSGRRSSHGRGGRAGGAAGTSRSTTSRRCTTCDGRSSATTPRGAAGSRSAACGRSS